MTITNNIKLSLDNADLSSADGIVDSIYVAMLLTPSATLHHEPTGEPAQYSDLLMFIKGCIKTLNECGIPITAEMVVKLLLSNTSFSICEDDEI